MGGLGHCLAGVLPALGQLSVHFLLSFSIWYSHLSSSSSCLTDRQRCQTHARLLDAKSNDKRNLPLSESDRGRLLLVV